MGSVIAVVGLALLDSLSLGTLVIPLALIVHWRAVRVPALTAYLTTVAAVYFLLGLGMLPGSLAWARPPNGSRRPMPFHGSR